MAKNFFIKIALFSILSLGICFIFTANQSPKTDKITIKFSSWGSESEVAIIKPVLKEFEAENPSINVEFIHIPNNYFQKLHLLAASNLMPDVVFINNIDGVVFEKNNILSDLSKYLKNDRLISEKDFFKNSLNAFNSENKLYAIPRDISNLVIYYNKDIFDKYHIKYPAKNWTFDDFLHTAKRLTKDLDNDGKIDQFGIGFENQSLFWLPFLWSNSGGITDQDLKKILLDKPESINAIRFYADLRNKYHVAPTSSEAGSASMSQLFMQQKIVMQINGRWCVPRFRKDLKFRWNIAKFPAGKAGSIVDADASGWAISKNSAHPEQAWKLIRFLASKKVCENFTKDGLIVPARIDVANSDIFLDKSQAPENSRLFIDIIPESKPTPVAENYQEMMDIINARMEYIWNGEKSPEQAINKDLVKELKKLLKS